MNIANVTSRFALLTGLDNSEIYKWKTLIDDACSYVGSLIKKKNPDSDEKSRIEMLCAVYAFRLYSLCNDDERITSFTAGDVEITSSAANSILRAERLWQEYAQKSEDLIGADNSGFLFGRVM